MQYNLAVLKGVHKLHANEGDGFWVEVKKVFLGRRGKESLGVGRDCAG